MSLRTLGLCSAGLLALGSSLVAADEVTPQALGLPTKGTMLLFGSSSVNDAFGHMIAEDLERLGFEVDRHGYSAAGLARPDFIDLRHAIEHLPIKKDASSVLLYVGANDAQSLCLRPNERERPNRGEDAAWVHWDDESWSSIYESRTTELLRTVCTRGARHAIVLPPVDVTNVRMQSRLERIRQIQRRVTSASTCGHFVSTAGDSEEFAMVGEPLRAADGFHMSRWGAQRVWQRVRDKVLSLLM